MLKQSIDQFVSSNEEVQRAFSAFFSNLQSRGIYLPVDWDSVFLPASKLTFNRATVDIKGSRVSIEYQSGFMPEDGFDFLEYMDISFDELSNEEDIFIKLTNNYRSFYAEEAAKEAKKRDPEYQKYLALKAKFETNGN